MEAGGLGVQGQQGLRETLKERREGRKEEGSWVRTQLNLKCALSWGFSFFVYCFMVMRYGRTQPMLTSHSRASISQDTWCCSNFLKAPVLHGWTSLSTTNTVRGNSFVDSGVSGAPVFSSRGHSGAGRRPSSHLWVKHWLVSLCRASCIWTYIDLPASASQVLGLEI